ncbi:hypothetical protein [Xanthomonas sp. 60]
MTTGACIALLQSELQALGEAIEEERLDDAARLMAAHAEHLAALDLTTLQPPDVRQLEALLQGQLALQATMGQRRDAARDGMLGERRAYRAADAYLLAESLA